MPICNQLIIKYLCWFYKNKSVRFRTLCSLFLNAVKNADSVVLLIIGLKKLVNSDISVSFDAFISATTI